MGLYITLCLSVSPLPPLSLSPTLSVFLHSLFQSTYLCKAYWSLVELRSFQSSIYLPIVVHQDWHGVQERASGFLFMINTNTAYAFWPYPCPIFSLSFHFLSIFFSLAPSMTDTEYGNERDIFVYAIHKKKRIPV